MKVQPRTPNFRKRVRHQGIDIILSFIISIGTRSLEVSTTVSVPLFTHQCLRPPPNSAVDSPAL